MSAFGGIVALNREVDDETALLLAETFLECIIAPRFSAPGAASPYSQQVHWSARGCRIGRLRSPSFDRHLPQLVFEYLAGGG